MLNEAVRKMLRERADRHHEVAIACASNADLAKAVHHRSTSDKHAAAAARIQPAPRGRKPTSPQRAELVALAMHHDRLSVAHSAKPDAAAAGTHARAAEDLRALLEDRPARAIDDVLVYLGLRGPPEPEPEPVADPTDEPAPADEFGKRRARTQG